jgi:hypothetical protein
MIRGLAVGAEAEPSGLKNLHVSEGEKGINEEVAR